MKKGETVKLIFEL